MSYSKHFYDKEAVVKRFFSDEVVEIGPEEILLRQEEENHRLFYVESGKFQGFLPNEQIQDPVFEAVTGTMLGVYSFFSEDHRSYTEVRSVGKSSYRYFSGDPASITGEDGEMLQKFFLDLAVEELKNRQHFAGFMAKERQKGLKKLIKIEKMAVLGQMSAGLAHELNNAIASIHSNLERLGISLKTHLNHTQQFFFAQGQEGETQSTADARGRRGTLEKIKGLDKSQVKRLAASALEIDDIKAHLSKAKQSAVQEAIDALESGSMLHDMRVAADHAQHVIRSVKTLGVANQNWSVKVDVNESLQQALIILKGALKKVEVVTELDDDLPTIQGSPGELIQVWINLIKNAAEALEMNHIPSPTISVRSWVEGEKVLVAIADNGKGIPESIQQKIFLPNFTTKVGGLSFGLGLGLPIVQRIVDEHNGSMKLVSEPGNTTFKISFPIIKMN